MSWFWAMMFCLMPQESGTPVLEGYSNYESYRLQIEKLESEYLHVSSIGKTLGGREIWVLTLGTGKVDEKPALAVVGGVDPSHLIGSELVVRMAATLGERAKSDAAIQTMLDRTTIYFLPRVTPDACESFFRKPYRERAGNSQKTDDDRDGSTGEDSPDDLNGDGFITVMRVEDETGSWVPHPDDPRVLIEAQRKEKNEKGRYLLYVEGKDDDHDEAFNEDGSDGVVFNRNFPHRYPYFQKGAGPQAVSEVETRSVADFLFSHRNIAMVFSFSPEDNLMNPWKADGGAEKEKVKRTVLGADEPYCKFISERYKETRGGSDAPPSPAGEGSFTEWVYYQYGRWSFVARGWWVDEEGKKEEGGKKKEEESRGKETVRALKWFDKEGIAGFVEWTEVPHPDFPGRKVEVGGVKPFYLLDPPAKEFDSLAEKHAAFLIQLEGFLPRLEISKVDVEDLGEGLRRLKATVVNTGYLPTSSEMGKVNQKPDPMLIQIQLPEKAALVTGHVRERVEILSGNGGKAEVTWILQGASGAEISLKVWSPCVGEAEKKIILP